MKGLEPNEYAEVLAFVQKYHKFALWMNKEDEKQKNIDYPNMSKWKSYGLNIKYIDSCYDSRTGDVWSITFRVNRFQKWTFTTNMFAEFGGFKRPKSWKDLSYFDIIKKFLKGEMTDKQVNNFFDPDKD